MMTRLMVTFLICFAFAAGAAEEPNPELYPDSIGPYAGDWEGLWSSGEKKHPWIGAQVIALDNGEYDIVLTRKLYARAPLFKTVRAHEEGDAVVFDDGEYYGKIAGGTFTGGRHGDKPGEFSMERYVWESPNLGLKPPEGAIVLFDGSGFDEWQPTSKEKWWDILPGGIMQANPDVDSLYTKGEFSDVRLHVEFRLPFLPDKRGQERANGGVFVQKYFEVQVLDSYGLPGYWNECGAIYQISGPRVNMCAPPLQWQSYDIEFRAARFDEKGALTEYPRMSVVHNGVPVQTDVELPYGTSGDVKKKHADPPSTPQSIRLQAHKNRVQWRNIWVVDLAGVAGK